MWDDVKDLIPSITAAVVVVIGMIIVYALIRDQSLPSEAGIAILAAAITQALNFMFVRQTMQRNGSVG